MVAWGPNSDCAWRTASSQSASDASRSTNGRSGSGTTQPSQVPNDEPAGMASLLSDFLADGVWHIGLFRDERTLKPIAYYNRLPIAPTVDVCLVLDPMLATGGSASATVDILKKWGAKKIKYMGLLAAPEGVKKLTGDHPDVPIFIAAIDDHLNDIGYIVPGLGDAGDRQFGTA